MELEAELTIRRESGWEDSWEVLCLDDRPLIEVLRERLAWEERVALEADGHLGQDYVTAGVVRLRVELCGPGRRPSVSVAEVYVGGQRLPAKADSLRVDDAQEAHPPPR